MFGELEKIQNAECPSFLEATGSIISRHRRQEEQRPARALCPTGALGRARVVHPLKEADHDAGDDDMRPKNALFQEALDHGVLNVNRLAASVDVDILIQERYLNSLDGNAMVLTCMRRRRRG